MLTGELWQSGLDVLGIRDQRAQELVKRVLQKCYYNICEKADWIGLRQSLSLTFAATDTTGLYLPPNLINVLGVVCQTDGEEHSYLPTDEENRYKLDGHYHWFYPKAAVTPLSEGSSAISIDNGSNQATGLGADRTNEWVRLGSQPGWYKVTAYDAGSDASTLDRTYWGPKLTDQSFVVRPPETRKLMIVDDAGDLDAVTAKVFYWAYPNPLFRDNDLPQLPGTRALELAMWADLVLPIEKRQSEGQTYRTMYERELDDMFSANPVFSVPVIPRDRTGRIIAFGRRR